MEDITSLDWNGDPMERILYCRECKLILDEDVLSHDSISHNTITCDLCQQPVDIYETGHSSYSDNVKKGISAIGIVGIIVTIMIMFYYPQPNAELALFGFISFLLFPYVLYTFYRTLVDREYKNNENQIIKEKSLTLVSPIFQRGPDVIVNRSLQEKEMISIYQNGLKSFVYETDRNGHRIRNGHFEYISNKRIKSIQPFQLIGGGVSPSGIRLTTKDGKICIIKTGLENQYFKPILRAFRASLGKKWKDVYSNEYLVGKDIEYIN